MGNVSRETGSGTSGDLSKEGKHGDTSVLELNETETVETVLVGISQPVKGVVESKRSLGTKLVLEGIQGGGGLAGLGGGKGGGRGDGGGKDDRLHFDC